MNSNPDSTHSELNAATGRDVWSKPKTVSQLDYAFGAAGSLIGNYLPPEKQIPKEFWNGRTVWNKLVSKWFFSGLAVKDLPLVREGIDRDAALRHLGTCLGSFEPKHEHKEAGCAYLMSLWFQGPQVSPVPEAKETPTLSGENENKAN